MLELIAAHPRRRMMRTSITAAGIAFGVAAVEQAGLAGRVAQLVPIGVVKG